MLKIWKLTLWKVSGVNENLGHILLGESFLTQDFWERQTLRLVPRDPNLVNGTNNVNIFVLVLHICLRTSFRLAHTAFFNWSLRTSHRTLLASFSSNFLFRDINRGRGNSSSNNWVSVHLLRTNVFKQDDTLFLHASKLNSKNMANTLLHGGFVVSFMKFNIFLFFTMNDLSASSDVIMILWRIHWGEKLNFPHF